MSMSTRRMAIHLILLPTLGSKTNVVLSYPRLGSRMPRAMLIYGMDGNNFSHELPGGWGGAGIDPKDYWEKATNIMLWYLTDSRRSAGGGGSGTLTSDDGGVNDGSFLVVDNSDENGTMA